MATKNSIYEWLNLAKTEGATHLIVVYDSFSYEDYPVSVKPPDTVQKVYDQYSKEEMQKVMEVYALHLDLQRQMDEPRSFHFEYPEDAAQIKKVKSIQNSDGNECSLPALYIQKPGEVANHTPELPPQVMMGIMKLLEQNGCDCDCDHSVDEHDDECERCLACRIGAILQT